MKLHRVGFLFGTRPEAIKMAPLICAMLKDPRFKPYVYLTGQHRSLLDPIIELFNLPIEADFQVMERSRDLNDVTHQIIQQLNGCFRKTPLDLMIVQGDTTSTFAGALAAFYAKIPVGHVEAGLRTYNRFSPWPEEVNRRMTTLLAEWHFAPTERAASFLHKEGVDPSKIFVTGNTVIDALLATKEKIQKDPALKQTCEQYFPFLSPERRLILFTAHRRENLGENHEQIFSGLIDLLNAFPDTELLFPVHPNPQVRQTVEKVFANYPKLKNRIHLVDPLNYPFFIYAMDRSTLIITDSGGVQEEAPSLKKPVLVVRDTTERPEAVDAGTAFLCGTSREVLVCTASRLLTDPAAYKAMQQRENPYGAGNASRQIIESLSRSLEGRL